VPPVEANRWLAQNMLPFYPLGVFKTPDGAGPRPDAGGRD